MLRPDDISYYNIVKLFRELYKNQVKILSTEYNWVQEHMIKMNSSARLDEVQINKQLRSLGYLTKIELASHSGRRYTFERC